MKQKQVFFSILVLLLAFSLCACTAAAKKAAPPSSPANAQLSGGETVYPLKFKDFMDREIVVAKEPQRIVSLSPGTTEILFALGWGGKVVGVTDYDDYPPEVLAIPKIGNYQGPDIESIVRQKPDIVFVSDLTGKDQIDMLEKTGFTVVMLQANNISGIMDSIMMLGRITGSQDQAGIIVQEMKDKINAISGRIDGLPRVKVFYLVDSQDNWTAGSGTFIDELIVLSGGINVAGDLKGWVKYSVEKVLEKDPDVIVSSSHAGDISVLPSQPGYKETKAVQNGSVFMISNQNIINHPSYRIVMGLEEIAKYLHPEAFE